MTGFYVTTVVSRYWDQVRNFILSCYEGTKVVLALSTLPEGLESRSYHKEDLGLHY